MKKLSVILGLTIGCLLCVRQPAAGIVDITDAPHSTTVSMDCADCHDLFTPGAYTDDVCLSCHNNATGGGYTKNSAPRMLTHSSATTTDKYGPWFSTCINCHDPHTQDQFRIHGTAAWLLTGTITTITDNGDGTSTLEYTGAVENKAGWGDFTRWGRKSSGNASGGNERGLIVLPNTADLDVLFEVISATASEMLIEGGINSVFPGRVAPGDTFALVYGQLVTTDVDGRIVRFYQNAGENSFAVNEASPPALTDPIADGMCQGCHTQTTHWRVDGVLADHKSGSDCMVCHKHEEGFRAGGCALCHDSLPATGTHDIHTGSVSLDYGTTDIQSQPGEYAFSCGICHKGTHENTLADPRIVEVIFAGIATGANYLPSTYSIDDPGTGYTFNYSDGTCSNVYCHGNYSGSGKNASLAFNTGLAPCGSCHNASNVTVPPSGSHTKHAASTGYNYNYRCSLCHTGEISGTGPASYTIDDREKHVSGYVDWAFDGTDPRLQGTPSYSIAPGSAVPTNGYTPRAFGTCSTVYCHSNVQPDGGVGAPTAYANPQWGATGSIDCGSCHDGEIGHGSPVLIATGSHTKHLEYPFLTSSDRLRCTTCHILNPAGYWNSCRACHPYGYAPPAVTHPNGSIDVVFDPYSPWGNPSYNGTPLPGDGYSDCSNTYCHSNGTSVSTLVVPANVSPSWGNGTLACDACHGNPPDYASGTPKKNSHAGHSGEQCSACHVNTTADGVTITDKAKHVNRFYDVVSDSAAGVSFVFSYNRYGSSCQSISCHGGGTASWGGGPLTCQNCHLGPVDVDDFAGTFYENGTTANIRDAGGWDATGHGRAAGTYASGNAAAGFVVADACLYCHDDTVTHKTVANPFRLRNITDGTWGKNGVCQNCHATGSAGVVVDSTLKNGSEKVGSTHYGSKHTGIRNGGQFCWDCHDPHGDSNIFMVHDAVAKTSDNGNGAPTTSAATVFTGFATGTDYAKSTAPFNGICNVCHTNTNHYTATSGDGHNAGTRCTSCHTHTGTTVTGAFQASCTGCHGDPPVDNTTLVGFTDPSSTGSTTAGAHNFHVNERGIGCDSCHLNSVGLGPTHNNGDLQVTIGFSLFSGTYLGGTYNGQSTVTYNASGAGTVVSSTGIKECGNLYCHGSTMAPNGGTDITPVWDNPATAECGTCHGATAAHPPTKAAHYRHTALYTSIGHEYPCALCHKDPTSDEVLHVNTLSEVIFSTDPKVAGASYTGSPVMMDAYGDCSNVYCHSNVQTSPPGGTLTYRTVNWNNKFASDPPCNICHEGPSNHYSTPLSGNTTGSHGKHAASMIYCGTCHANDLNANPVYDGSNWGCLVCHTVNGPNVTHANYAVDVNIVTMFGGTYSGSPVPGDAYGNCSSTYCHSTGVSLRTGVIPANTTPDWGNGPLACNSCHGNEGYPSPDDGMPDYQNGSPKENSHRAHVITNEITCGNCHNSTTTNGTTIANPTLHTNRLYNTLASGTFAGMPVSFTYTPATTATPGSCAAISCHGGADAVWGGTLTCQDCHLGPADIDDFTGTFWDNGISSRVGETEWDATGHGRPAYNYTSGSPASSFVVTDACLYCHDDAVAHKTVANPFRLRSITDGTWGKNGVCQNCHAAGSSGISVDGASRNGMLKVGSVHYGAKHDALSNGGQFCWDCHDPHGDSNIFMVHDAVAKTSDNGNGAPTVSVATIFTGFATGTDYAKSSAPFNGICNVCHTNTNHYTATGGDGHNAGTRCTSCHTHTGNTMTNAFQASCNACHGDPPVDNTTLVGFTDPSSTGSTTAGAHDFHVRTELIGCDACHVNSVGTGALHNNGDLRVTLGFSPFGGLYTGGDYNGQSAVSYNSSDPDTGVSSGGLTQCSNIYCHGDYPGGGKNASPTWSGTAACGSCHNASNATVPPSGSHTKHAASTGYNYNYRCTLCHTGEISGTGPSSYTIENREKHVSGYVDWAFDGTDPRLQGAPSYSIASGTAGPSNGYTRSYGTCANVYCHSNVQPDGGVGGPTAYASPQWGNAGTVECGSCHDGEVGHGSPTLIATGSHTKHLEYPFLTSSDRLRCTTCHILNPAGYWNNCRGCHPSGYAPPAAKHPNGSIDVVFDPYSPWGNPVYNGTPLPGDGYSDCSNTYCHSNGTSVSTLVIPANVSPSWGSGTLACNACHGYPPAYADRSPKRNGHGEHSQEPCSACHVTTTADGVTITDPSRHVNRSYDVVPDTGAGVSFSYTFNRVQSTCSNISCHGGGSEAWGDD